MNKLIENTYFSFVNLDHRKDRLILMENELSKAGIVAERTPGILPKDLKGDLSKYKVMMRTPGACGCHEAQVSIMKKALSLNKHAGVFEDDLIICSDIQKRLDHVSEFLNTHVWDCFWWGGTFHVNPPWWHSGRNANQLGSDLGRDAETTDDPRIMRTYGAFSTFAYIVNVESIEKILKLFDKYVHLSMGIDWLFILLQPQLYTYAFVPGCVKQYDNMSDIGIGYTIFSGFEKLNGTKENSAYWWQNLMEQFDPTTFDWHEAKIK